MADWRDAIPSVDEFVQRDTPLIPEQPKPAESGTTDWREAIPDAPGFESAPTPPKEMHRVVAQDTTPDTEAKIAQLSMRSRLPDALIRSDLRTAEAYDEYKRMRDATASTPATARFLSIAENMAAARDDAEALAEVERSLLAYGKANYEVGQLTVQLALLRSRQAHGDDSDATQAKIDELKGKMQEMQPGEYENVYERVVGLIGSQAPIQLYIGEQAGSYAAAGASGGALWGATVAGTPTAGVGAPVGAGAGASIGGGAGATVGTIKASYELESGLSYDEYLDAGMDKNTAAWAAKIYGGIASIIETASLGPLKRLIPGASRFTDEAIKTPVRATIKRAIFSYVKNGGKAHLYESVEEGLQTFAQGLVKWAADSYDAGQLVDWEEPTGEKMKQAVEDTLLTPIAPVLGTPSLGFDLASGVKNLKTAKAFDQLEALQAMLGQMQTSEQSQREQEALMQLREKVLATKTKTRNPRKAEEHIQGILDRSQDVPQEVYIPAARLVEVMDADPGIVAPLLEELELSQGEVAEAAAQGIDLAVSTAKYAAYAMGTDLDTALVNDLRLSPNSMTAAQLVEAERVFGEDLARHTEALRRKDEARTVIEQERQQVYEDVKRQLVANNVKAPEENAVAMAAAFATMSQRYGNGSPLELYNAVGLNTRRFADLAAYDAAKKEGLAQEEAAAAGADSLGFFSPTAKAIEAMEFNTIPPADLINRIKKTPGVKQEELEDLGLLDWLAGVEGKVSKADVLDFIQKGGPQIEEIVKAGAGFEGRSARMQELITRENDGTITEEEVYELDDLEGRVGRGEQAFDDTKYSKHQLPGGANAMVNLKIATPKGNTIVTMFGTENESSFLHESGHIFFELLGFMARQPGAPQTATEDWQTVLDFVGNDGATPLTREQHEKLARSIEAYFLEGKAPSLRLRQVFQKFADWLKRIYVDFEGLMGIAKQDITPTPEIVALMDRMFATDEEIAQAQNYYGQKDVYEAEAAKIGEEEQAKYLAAVEEAQTEAKDNNMRRRMRAWAKVTGGRKRIEQQVRDEVNAEPVYALMDALRTEENGRLDLDSLSFAVGDEARKALSKKSLTKREGSDPYIRAARFGFASVDEMVTALLNAEKKSERIKAEVDKRMAEAMNELGRANTVGGMPVADQDVHTDAKLSVLFMELDMLRKQFAREEAAPERALRSLTVTAKRNAVKAAARRRLEGMKAKDARRYDTFSRAEAQASRESRAALEKGDYMAAEQAKLREIINHAMVIEAVKFREEMAAAEDMVSKAKSQKNMLADSRDLINDIAMRFGFHSAPQSRTAKMFEVYRAQLEAEGNLPNTLLAWADKMEEEGLTVFAPEWIDNAPPRPYQNLTVDQFRDVTDAIRSIKTADRMQRIVITDEQGRTREQLIEDLKAAAAQNAKRKARPDRTDSRGRRLVNATHAWHIKMETVFIDLDGGKPGLFWETFYLPFEKAFNEEQTRLKAANEKINELFGRFNTKRQISMSTEKIRIEAIGKSMTKWQAIMAALNMGNDGNMNRLTAGEQWNPEQAKAVLDVLEKDEMDFVQAVWDYFDSFREESFALERKLTGRTPKRVEPKPLETRHGVYAGGYFPIVNDPKLGIKAAYRELKDAATGGGSLKGTHHAAAATRRNHLKERTRGTGEKLLLDPSVISNHVFQVIHDLTHREAVQGVAQLSRDGKITDILQDYAGFDVTKAMSQWVVDIAAEQNGPQSPIHKFARWARTGTTLMSMGFKATTGVTQFVGYTSTIDQLKGWDKKYAAVGLATTYRNPAKLPTLLRETFEKSKFMEGRIKSFDRDIRDATRRIGSNSVESKRLAKALGYADIAADKVAEFAFTHIGVAQMSVDLPTWWAMYAKVMDETNNEAQAVRAADSFVRQTQGGGATKDLARIQRGDDLMRLFTMFYSFFNTLYNMAYLSGRYVQKQGFTRGGVAAAAGSVMWLWFLPSLTAELLAGRGPDEDDGEGWAEWALPILALYPTQSIVGLRDVANAIGTKYDYAMTPAQAPLQSFDRWVGAVNKAWEEEDATLLVKPSVEAVGYLMHLPLGQAVITGQNLVDYATGEDPEFYLRDLLFKKPESRR